MSLVTVHKVVRSINPDTFLPTMDLQIEIFTEAIQDGYAQKGPMETHLEFVDQLIKQMKEYLSEGDPK